MTSVTLAEAQARLPEILHQLRPGEKLTIIENGHTLAEVTKSEQPTWPCKAGSARGKIRMAPDFDAPLEEFKE